MKKLSVFAAVFLIFAARVFSETVLVAPIILYDKDSNRIKQNPNPAEKIYDSLYNYWFEGLVDFKKLSSREYDEIYTVFDANRVCALEEADYILFGYITKNEGNWFSDIKLYNYKSKKIAGEYYSGDDIAHYDRLIENLSRNILEGIEDETGLSRNKIVEEEKRELEIKLPASIFYWSPVDGDWGTKMLGIAGLEAGCEIYPTQKKLALKQKLIDFSVRPSLSYSYAMGRKNVYPLNYHGIMLTSPVLAHIHFNPKNSLYTGFGLYYEFEVMNIIPKYENQKSLYQNIFGLEYVLGYETVMNDKINFFTELRLDSHVNEDTFMAVKGALGLSVNLFRAPKKVAAKSDNTEKTEITEKTEKTEDFKGEVE